MRSTNPAHRVRVSKEEGPAAVRGSGFLPLLIILAAVLAFLFRDSFRPNMALFANDGPLGAVKWICDQGWGSFRGVWSDLNWLGLNGGASTLGITSAVAFLVQEHAFINFYPALTIAGLGIAAWLFFRSLGFHRWVCVLGGVAAALNTDFFSYACWGLPTLTLCVAWVFLALAAMVMSGRSSWLGVAGIGLGWPVLAGVALGCALVEGFDNGAIFSLYVAAFIFGIPFLGSVGGGGMKKTIGAGLQVFVVALVALVVSAQVMETTVRQVLRSSAAGAATEEDAPARSAVPWEFATQWSLPPRESLRTVIAGLYGYRMDTADGGQYWGRVGMDPAWDAYWANPRRNPAEARWQAQLRYSGAGHYAGVLVVLIALFGVVQSFVREGGGLHPEERRWVWFWAVVAVVSLLFAFGRFAPFYRIIYALPFFNSVRNPVKFLHPFSMALVVLFAYGLQALWRGWLSRPAGTAEGIMESLAVTWRRGGPNERRWMIAGAALVGAGILGWLVYGSQRDALLRHLAEVGFRPDDAQQIARFSHGEVGVFVLLLGVSVALLLVALSGWFSGRRAMPAFAALGLLLVVDLARANVPWIIHYDWKVRYASNPVLQVLSEKPHEGRVTGRLPFDYSRLPSDAAAALQALESLYGLEWLQHQFRYYAIQSLDIVQMPRAPGEFIAYKRALAGNPVREWTLGNTRYILTLAPLVEALNQQLDPVERRFRLHTGFQVVQEGEYDFRVQTNTAGPFGIVEFTGALPRARLYSHWRSGVPDAEALSLLAGTNFNPETEVLVAEEIPQPSGGSEAGARGTAVFLSYSPKRYVISTDADVPSVLLVNDKHDSNWRVLVDGREAEVLRVNYAARGVHLDPGAHEVEFRFEPPAGALWISLAGLLAGAALLPVALMRGRPGHAAPG